MMTACKNEGDEQKQAEQLAVLTAKGYYDNLVQGKYGDFVAGMDFLDSIPANYRKQLEDNAAMFIEDQKTSRKGIVAVDTVSCSADLKLGTANAFLRITYNDSTKEEICVPMVKRGDLWLMR